MRAKKIEYEVAQIMERTGVRGERALARLSARVARRASRTQVQHPQHPRSALGYLALASPVASDPGNRVQRWFVNGFELVREGVATGRTPDESYDASRRVPDAPPAFGSGARAARDFYNSLLLRPGHAARAGMDAAALARHDRDKARELAREYAVVLPG